MNKKKLISRIIAGILIVVLLLGLIVPVVSASELDTTTQPTTTVDTTTTGEAQAPSTRLPDGFQYVWEDGRWTIKRVASELPLFVIGGLPDDVVIDEITLFIGNLETEKCVRLDLVDEMGYVDAKNLPEGYYVIFGSPYCWENENGKKYRMLDYQYFYVGENFDSGLYGETQFDLTHNNIIYLDFVESVGESYQVVEYGENLGINDNAIVFPKNIVPQKTTQSTETPSTQPTEGQQQETKPTEDPNVDNEISFFDIIMVAIRKTYGLLICLAIVCIASFIYKQKNNKKSQARFESDSYDDGRID